MTKYMYGQYLQSTEHTCGLANPEVREVSVVGLHLLRPCRILGREIGVRQLLSVPQLRPVGPRPVDEDWQWGGGGS